MTFYLALLGISLIIALTCFPLFRRKDPDTW